MLRYSTRVMLCLLVCIGLLSDNRYYKVSALRNREFFLRKIQGDEAEVEPGEIFKLRSIDIHPSHNREGQGMLSGNRRILEEVNKDQVKAEAQKDQSKDSFQSSKRRVRRGSDPIHNKSQPLS